MNHRPDWLVVLAEACAASSQIKVARMLGCSPTVVNQVVHGKYPGDIDRFAERVRGVLLGATHECPVLGEISKRRCLDEQVREFAATNPARVQLWKACRAPCTHYRGRVEA
jgi:predicted transcriptional regulator